MLMLSFELWIQEHKKIVSKAMPKLREAKQKRWNRKRNVEHHFSKLKISERMNHHLNFEDF